MPAKSKPSPSRIATATKPRPDALARAAAKVDRAILRVVDHLSDPDPSVSARALRALERFGVASLGGLLLAAEKAARRGEEERWCRLLATIRALGGRPELEGLALRVLQRALFSKSAGAMPERLRRRFAGAEPLPAEVAWYLGLFPEPAVEPGREPIG